MWVIPASLLFLAINQARVAVDIRHTLEQGADAVAEVIEFRINERVDIPFGYISLRVDLEGGASLVKEKMALPYTLLPQVRYLDSVDVRVLPGASQPIVIAEIASTQWKMAGLQSLICLVGFLMAGAGVFFWNRMLYQKGDPAEASSGVAMTS